MDELEIRELLEKLSVAGHTKLVDTLLMDTTCYTKKGRLNKSAACRALGWKVKELQVVLLQCRELLRSEYE